MRKTILAMTVLAAFACTAQTSNPTSPTTPPDQTQSSPTTTAPSTTPTPDMQQSTPATPTPDAQPTPSTTAPDSQSTPPSAMPQSDQPSAATPAPAESTAGQASSAAGQTYDGCIREKHGKYMLMTMDGQKYMLNSSQDLSAHKGHEVKVTGDVSSGSGASAMSESNEKGETAAQEKTEHMKGNMQTLNVTNLDMVSTTCSMGHMKKGMDHDNGMSNPK